MAIGTDQALNTPMVLLLGASSQIGVFAIPKLLGAGFHVLAVSRKGRPKGYPVFEQVEWLSEKDAVQAAQDCQYLLSAGPLELAKRILISDGKQDIRLTMSETRNLIRGPLQTAVIFSSSSVETKQESNNPVERSQIQDMLALESDIKCIAESRGFNLVLLRPTLIYGCGLDTNISRLASWIRRFGFMPVNGKAVGLRQPVHAEDLATAAIAAMLNKSKLPAVMPLAGGETLSYSDMVTKIFMSLEKPVRLVHLPEWLFVLLVRFAGIVGIGRGINTEMVKRQGVDLVFDNQQAKDFLDYSPRSFNPVEEDFSRHLPAQEDGLP